VEVLVAEGATGKKKQYTWMNDSLWRSPWLAAFYDADVSTGLATLARIVIFWKVTFHLSAVSLVSCVQDRR
jgi:hypothetical protein